jgi:hypothetical protein
VPNCNLHLILHIHTPHCLYLDVCASLLLGEWSLLGFKSAYVHTHFHKDCTHESEIWLDDAEIGEQSLRLVVLDRRVDNDVVARDPVDGCGDAVLVTGLQRVEDAQDLSRVAASGCGV